MKLQIGQTLKKLRAEHAVTQEQLAEALGVSCQSVSRWELNICYPDIELLPVLANYFEVTLDDLMGMQKIRSEETRSGIFTVALEHERQENWHAAIEVLRNALKDYPGDDGFLTELALCLSKTDAPIDKDEAITLSERVLSRCTDEKLRSTVRANLCFLYKAAGQPEKAATTGRTLPHIWECREVLLCDLVPEESRPIAVTRAMNIALQVLRAVACGKRISFSLGYRPEAAVDTDALLSLLKKGAAM